MRPFSTCIMLFASLAISGQTTVSNQNRTSDSVDAPNKQAIYAVRIARPNIQLTGSRLARVEIWIEPTGTGVGEELVGNAKRITPAGNHEKWIFPISSFPGYPHPIMAVNAFAKAYDRRGREIGRKSLPFNGVSEFNSALYGRAVQ